VTVTLRIWAHYETIFLKLQYRFIKKRSKLEHQKLQDLFFVDNQILKDCCDSKDLIDLILLDNIDDCNEWLIGEMG